MMAIEITVGNCGICNKKCDEVRISMDKKGRNYLITAKCHGKTDKHEVPTERVDRAKHITLIPFK